MQETLFFGSEKPYVVSFSSPKGGMGTTLLCVNSAIQLAKKGNNVLLIDLALSRASCHLALQMSLPEKNLSLLSSSKGFSLCDCVVPTQVANLSLIASMPESFNVANMPYLVKTKIISEMSELQYDYIIIDSGSGTSFDSLDFTLSSHFAVFVVSPTPFCLEPFYRYLRAFLHRSLVLALNKKRYQAIKEKINFNYPLKGLVEIEETMEEDIKEIVESLRSKHLSFVFVKASERDLKIGAQIEAVVKRFYEIKMEFLGNIEWDEMAEIASINLEPISKNYPLSPFSLSVEKVVNRITKLQKEPPETYKRQTSLEERSKTAYEILEIPPNANVKDIQLAYQRKLEIFADNSYVTIGILTKEEKEKERDILEQNYKLLINKEIRKKYDEELISKNLLKEEERISEYKEIIAETPVGSLEAKDKIDNLSEKSCGDLSEIAFYDGPSLKKIRQLKRISIEEIVSETNIRSWYIESIEMERYDALPARLYLKGFLKQIAKYLKLPEEKVLRDYLEKYDNWASSTNKKI